MHFFIIVASKKEPLNPEWAKNLLANYEQLIIPIQHPLINEWGSRDGRMYVKSWCREGIIYSEKDFFYADDYASSLHLFDGWVRLPGQTLQSSLQTLYLQNDHLNLLLNDYSGEFTYLRLDSDGVGKVFRNKLGLMPVYFAENSKVQILSNRASIAALVMNGSPAFEVDPIFQISMLGVGWPLFGNTLFKNIHSIHPRNEIYIKNSGISVSKTDRDIFHVEQLRSLFHESPKRFWDNLFDFLCDSVKILLEVDKKHPITLFLSGGKDSRLIFSLAKRASLLDKLDIVSTGAPYSHDVIVARQITSHYNIDQRFADSVFKSINYSELLPSHIFLSEARTGPYNISMFNESSNAVTLTGHEIGLREDIVTKNFDQIDVNALNRMNRQYFGDFNYAGILKSEIQKQFSETVEEWLASAIKQTPDIRNTPWRFRNESRCSGYLGFVKFLGDFQKGFAFYFLMTDSVLSYAYNADVEARSSEQLHYEILKRVDPWLVYDCPFGGQEWSKYIRKENFQRGIRLPSAFPILRSKNAPKLGAFAVFNNNRQQIFDYILHDNNELFEFVDKNKVEKLNTLTNVNDKTLRIVWNMFMLKYIASNRNFIRYSPFRKERTPNNIPEVKLNISPQINEKLFEDRSKIKALVEKSAQADYYRDAMIQLLWETNYSERGNNLVMQGKNAAKENDFEEAFSNFLAAAKLGNNEAKLELGRLYFTGKGVNKNFAKAAKYLSEAYEARISGATFHLAKCFYGGLGVKKNGEKALTLFLKAIDRAKFWGLERAGDLTKDLYPDRDFVSLWKRAADFIQEQCRKRIGVLYLLIMRNVQREKNSFEYIKDDIPKWFEIAKKAGFSLTFRSLNKYFWNYLKNWGMHLNKVQTTNSMLGYGKIRQKMAEFKSWFSWEHACRDDLYAMRWPNGFTCPRCTNLEAWPIGVTLFECSGCHYQLSLTAGAIFQESHKPLMLWFRAIWWITGQKNGASALVFVGANIERRAPRPRFSKNIFAGGIRYLSSIDGRAFSIEHSVKQYQVFKCLTYRGRPVGKLFCNWIPAWHHNSGLIRQ